MRRVLFLILGVNLAVAAANIWIVPHDIVAIRAYHFIAAALMFGAILWLSRLRHAPGRTSAAADSPTAHLDTGSRAAAPPSRDDGRDGVRGEETARLRAFATHLDTAREDDRGQLARRLHDDFGQSITALGLQLSSLRRVLPSNLEVPNATVREMEALVTSMMTTVRSMMSDLQPAVLKDFGLAAAIGQEVRAFQARTGVHCQASVSSEAASDRGERAVALFRALQAALDNAAARGARRVTVALAAEAGTTAVHVEDDGAAVSESALPWELFCVRERTHLLGGTFQIERSDNSTTRIRLGIPTDAIASRSPPAPWNAGTEDIDAAASGLVSLHRLHRDE